MRPKFVSIAALTALSVASTACVKSSPEEASPSSRKVHCAIAGVAIATAMSSCGLFDSTTYAEMEWNAKRETLVDACMVVWDRETTELRTDVSFDSEGNPTVSTKLVDTEESDGTICSFQGTYEEAARLSGDKKLLEHEDIPPMAVAQLRLAKEAHRENDEIKWDQSGFPDPEDRHETSALVQKLLYINDRYTFPSEKKVHEFVLNDNFAHVLEDDEVGLPEYPTDSEEIYDSNSRIVLVPVYELDKNGERTGDSYYTAYSIDEANKLFERLENSDRRSLFMMTKDGRTQQRFGKPFTEEEFEQKKETSPLTSEQRE